MNTILLVIFLILLLSFAISMIAAVITVDTPAAYQQKKDVQIYNNGIHSIDGGEWVYKDTSGKYGNYYTFECSKCGEFVTLCGVDGN